MFSSIFYAKTIPETNIDNCKDACELAHNINEVVGYQLEPLIIIIGVGMLIIIFQKERDAK